MHALRYVGSSPTLNQTAKTSGLRRRRGGHASRKNLALSRIMVNQPRHGAGKSYRSAGPSTSTEGQFELRNAAETAGAGPFGTFSSGIPHEAGMPN